MSLQISENNQSIKKGESVFYGIFSRYLWRNEKTGNSYFHISTKQKLILKEQYQKKVVHHNNELNTDTIWYTVKCDCTQISAPYYNPKTPVRITGYFLNNQNGDCWNFRVTSIKEASVEETVTIEYLASASFPGISYENAVTIVHHHGADIFSFIKQSGAAKEIQNETGMAESTIKDMFDIIGSTVEERRLFEKLGPIGIPYPFCAKAVSFYGTSAEKKIRSNPHYYGHKLGLTFAQCDRVSEVYGYRYDYQGRISSAIYETMNQIGNNGHVWTTQNDYYQKLTRILQTGVYDTRSSLVDYFGAAKRMLGIASFNKIPCFYNKKLYRAETRIARNLIRLSNAVKEEQPWCDNLIPYAESACEITYGEQQRAAFPTILRSRGLKVIIGGPGTGKTTTIQGILLAYQNMFPEHIIKLCAPTGRAAQRLAESTGMEASTVHRLLDYRPYGDSNTHKDANNPIEANLIVIDEMSMMEIELFDILLSAVKTGTTLIFVGDIHQLESVGAGSILSDLLLMPDTFISKSRLTDVFRQKGGSPIIENSIRINEGKTKLKTCEDFQIISTKCEEESRDAVVKLMKELYNPQNPFETQILCPARKGLAGIENLNTVLQQELNPGKKGMQYGHTQYRNNDKIMMMNNNYDIACNYYNGDIGVIKEIDSRNILVEIRGEVLEIKKHMLEEMRLSYGMSIHKSQGSEFENIIVVMSMNPGNMLVRNLFYTAVTRAKKRVFIINEGSAMETAIRRDKSSSRRTTLLSQVQSMLGIEKKESAFV